MIDLDSILFENDVLRCAADVDIVVGEVGEVVDALGKLRVQGGGLCREVSGKNLDRERKHWVAPS
jgi:hypothetical protein